MRISDWSSDVCSSDLEEARDLDGEVHDHEPEDPPPTVHDPEGDEAEAGRQADEDRAEQQAELRDTEGELALRRQQALDREPSADDVRGPGPATVGGADPRLEIGRAHV